MAETVDSNGVIPYTDRLNYVSSLINNMGYCMALEKLLGISVPERCHYMRGILSGISRITDHLTCVGATAVQLGAFTVFLYMIKRSRSPANCSPRRMAFSRAITFSRTV